MIYKKNFSYFGKKNIPANSFWGPVITDLLKNTSIHDVKEFVGHKFYKVLYQL